MQARNRTWLLGSNPVERCRQRTMNVEGGDGSTLSLDFTTGVFDPRLTFTRTTNATFINSQGYVEWANSNMYWNTAFEGLSGTNPSLTSSGWGYVFSTGNAVFNGDGTVTVTTTASDRRAIFRSTGFTGNGLRVVAAVDVTIHSGSLTASQVIVTGTPTNAQHYVNGVIWNSSHPIWNGGVLPVGTSFNIAYATDSQTGSTTSMYFGVGCTSAIAGSATFSNPRWTMWKGSGTVPYYPNTSATNNSTTDRYKSNDYQAPRFDYDPITLTPRGLLIEGSANNLCQQGQFCWGAGSTFTWVRSAPIHINSVSGTSGANAVARIDGPDNGSLTGTSIFKDSGSTFVRSNIDATVTASTQYTYSMWVRAGTGGTTYFRLAPFNGGSALTTVGACSDPSVGIDNASGFGTRFSNLPTDRWVRVWVVFTTAASQTTAILTVYPNLTTSDASTNYIWGAQLESGNGASSVIPTGASQGSRAYDHCYATGANFTSWFSVGAGTMVVVSDNIKNNTQNLAAMISDDSTSNYVRMGFKVGGAANEYLLTTVGGASSFQGAADSGYAPSLNTVYKMAYAWDTNNFGIVANGGTVVTDTSGTLAGAGVLTRMVVGGDFVAIPNDIYFKNGHIRSLKYCPTRLPNAELQALTDPGDTSTLTLNFTTGSLDPRVSFSRAGGGTYVGPDGFIYGIDNATSSSLAIGTGSKSVTLTATAGTNRRFEVGQTVYFSNGANNMSGAVTAYSPSTQVITINATATSGSGSFTSWVVGNASPRFDYNPATLSPRGLLIEGAADNICIQSENFGTWIKLQAADVVTANAGLSPNGQQNAYKISPSSVTGGHGVYRGITVSGSTTYTQSVYAKAGELNWLLMTEANTLTATASFNLATGTVGTISGTGSPVAYMQNAGNGWWRCVFMFTTTGSQTDANVQFRPTIGDGQLTAYFGNGVDGIYVWGAQAQAYALSSYIPTDASQRSRVADSVTMTGSNFSSWFNSSEGTFTVQYETVYSTKTLQSAYLLAFDSSASKRVVYLQTDLEAVGSYDGTSIINPTGDATGVVAHVASAYSATDRAIVLNGGTVATGTIAAGYSTATSLGIGASVPFVTIKQIKFYPTRLTNAQMQGLTK